MMEKYILIHFFKDESYQVCYELKGKQDELIAGLNRLSSIETGLTFAAKISLNGQYEGRTILYEADSYPNKCLGPCRFMWMPVNTNCQQEADRRIWLWVHPSFYTQFEMELLKIFQLKPKINLENLNINSESTEDVPALKKRKLENKKTNEVELDSIDMHSWTNNQKTIHVKCLKDKLIRFKLLGPLSATILSSVLHVADLDQIEIEESLK
jgi:hypothetical protein